MFQKSCGKAICFRGPFGSGYCCHITIGGNLLGREFKRRGRNRISKESQHRKSPPAGSVSKKAEKLSNAPAAVFVITQEDIRRSGVTSIPEALRMVPGLEVAKIDANKWAITSRGFNSRFANKLLVLMDGRTLYTPMYSGVFWDIQDTLLEDVDRIEVIRGPGATLWGANAVNGVINIITKNSKETQGTMISGGMGTEERGFGSIRYGTEVGNEAYVRAYGKYFSRDAGAFPNGDDAHDDWESVRGGFRTDWQASENISLTLQGDIYDCDSGQTITSYQFTPPYSQTHNADIESSGGNLLWRLTRSLNNSEMSFQAYYDRTEHREIAGDEKRQTFDLDFQHCFRPLKGQELIWGLGYRLSKDDVKPILNNLNDTIEPDSRHDDLFSAFFQDEIAFFEDRLFLILGSKFEHNEYTGFEIQPNVRLSWLPDERHSFWASVSRAVRTPSRGEHDAQSTIQVMAPTHSNPFPAAIRYLGNSDMESEVLMAYELGYRTLLTDRASLDFAVFYNDYLELVGFNLGTPYFVTGPIPHYVFPVSMLEAEEGYTYGLEMAGVWALSDRCRINVAYTYLKTDIIQYGMEKMDPRHQVSIRNTVDLSKNVELDLWARYVDELPDLDTPDYVTLDVRLGWKPLKNVEISLVGQNLLDPQHGEYTTPQDILSVAYTEVQRGIYMKIEWRF